MPVLVFDVNETLIDLAGLRPAFDDAFGDGAGALREWFPTLLHLSGVANEIGRYRPFGQLGLDALEIVAGKRGLSLETEKLAGVLARFGDLRPHPDVVGGLAQLQAAGLRMATLTNSPYDGLAERLNRAGILPYLEQVLSVDEVRRFKPAPEVYRMAAGKLEIELTEMVMIAAHDWDLMGAKAVGARTAFIRRPGSGWSYPEVTPDYEGGDLIEVASHIIADLD